VRLVRWQVSTLGGTVALAAGLAIALAPTAKAPTTDGTVPSIARLDGKPNLSGIWQAANTANWNIEPHSAAPGPIPKLGAAFGIPAGVGIVEGDAIPYRPEMLAKKEANERNWLKRDPEIRCGLPGVPRAMYLPYPFQIVHGSQSIMMVFQFASASRTIRLDVKEEPPTPTWMGWSSGRWEGDTLVVDVSGFTDQTWFDRAGNFHSAAMRIVERYRLIGPDHIGYEATIDDPKVFTQPWKIAMPLYRRIERDARLLEYRCAGASDRAADVRADPVTGEH
jgi:hypothetical protein